jgi:hypothetical protein
MPRLISGLAWIPKEETPRYFGRHIEERQETSLRREQAAGSTPQDVAVEQMHLHASHNLGVTRQGWKTSEMD